MTIWFKDDNINEVDIEKLYHLQQTEGRGNVQIILQKLERLSHELGDFFVVIHDGETEAYYIPFSFLRDNVLPIAKERVRPSNPNQRYLTVDKIRNRNHVFSFGNNRNNEQLRVNLSAFYNTINQKSEIDIILHQHGSINPVIPFIPGGGPYILSSKEAHRYGLDITRISETSNHPLLNGLTNLRFSFSIQNDLLITLKNPSIITSTEIPKKEYIFYLNKYSYLYH